MSTNWITTIGLEIHIQLKTQRKLFSYAPNKFGQPPNTQASYVDLGLPGTLPIINRDAINMAIKFGLALKSDILTKTRFSRKNYFYPDLPKGYQITQDAYPIIKGGSLNICLPNKETKTIQLTRAHLEEDAGKSIHDGHKIHTGLDFNRAGVPLLEIVTEPQLSSAEEAILFLKKVHSLVVCLDICTGNMQEGAFRCDANVSIRPNEEAPLGNRVEIKNLNSFKFIEKAINYEIARQAESLEDGGKIRQETRLFDTDSGITKVMRSKENAEDYRYFPDPDLPSVSIPSHYIKAIEANLPELPWEKEERFKVDYLLSDYDAQILTSDMNIADFFEDIFSYSKVSPKLAANWLCGEVLALLNKHNTQINDAPLKSKDLAEILCYIEEGNLSGSAAKIVLEEYWQNPTSIKEIIDNKNLLQNNNEEEISTLISKILENNPKQLEEYVDGKEKLFGFFVGQAMKLSKGKANPKLLNKLLIEKLSALVAAKDN